MNHLEVPESSIDRVKPEAKDDEAQNSMFRLSSTDLNQRQPSVDNQGSAGRARAINSSSSTSSESSEESRAEEVQAQRQADRPSISTFDQVETPSAYGNDPILAEQRNHASTTHLDSLLAEAKEFYKSEWPPFVVRNYHLHPPGCRRTYLLATEDGQFPLSNARETEIVYSSWADNSVYATMNLNGNTEIVHVQAGSHHGSRVRLWLGTEKGFLKTYVAYNKPRSSNPGAVKRIAASANSEALSDEPPPRKILRASKPIRVSDICVQLNRTADSDAVHERTLRPKVASRATIIDIESDSDGDHETALLPRQENGSVNKSPALPTPGASIPRTLLSYDDDAEDQMDANDGDSYMDKDEIDALLLQLRDEGKTFKAIRDHIDAKTGKNTTVGCWFSRHKRIEAEQAKSRAEGAARSRLPKINNRRQSKPLSVHRESLGDDTEGSASKSTSVKHDLHPSPRLSQKPSRAGAAEQIYNKPVFSTAAPQAALETFGEGPLLTPQKLNHTTLRILHSGSYTPLKLRSCITIRALFDTVKDLCSLKFAQKRMEALKVTFTWMPGGDSSRTMLLKEQYEDSFEFFLETVDEAPCWQSGTGKCNVDIEMV
ncbi:MAG: hypothetical protein Q9191_000931 [Dirinaria sp. TL-2023a]